MSAEVQGMFARIAGRYDLANDVLSLGIHRKWRGQAVQFLAIPPGSKVLDLCTGTGDQARAIADRVGSKGSVVGLDFVPEMLKLAQEKSDGAQNEKTPIFFMQGDACNLPLLDSQFDVVTVSFGIRNVDNPLTCLHEIYRVLVPGGKVMVLEFGKPTWPLFSSFYSWYGRNVMPVLGGLVTGDRSAYEYLPRTAKNFPDGRDFLQLLQAAKFECLRFKPLLSGLAYIYSAEKGARTRERGH